MAALTKETALLLLPAFVWAMWRNTDPRNRAEVLTVATGAGLLLMALYPLFALYKGELVEGPGHNSLLGTATWQLAEREPSGSLLTAHSPMRRLFDDWRGQDAYLLLGGLAAAPVALAARRLRPIVLSLAIGWLVMLRGGYVPFMHVITLLPWSALLVGGAIEIIGGNVRVLARGAHGFVRRSDWRSGARIVLAAGLGAGLLVGAGLLWPPKLRPMMTTTQPQPLRAAERWVADNVPRDKVLVVHDSIWVDLTHRYRFRPRPIIAHKLDTDPAVQKALTRIDYLIVPNWYYKTPTGTNAYPTLLEARKHAVAVAAFGSDDDGVRVYRVSTYWQP